MNYSQNTMPVMFFGHGNPMNAITPNKYAESWIETINSIDILRKPKAILCISAHWEESGTRITSNIKQRTIHDFGGFPRELHNVQYCPNGSMELVKRVQELIPCSADDSWGLDHGTWSILKHTHPNEDIPVLQLSLDMNKSIKEHYELAAKLKPLRDEGILIIGSGNIVHNLRKIKRQGVEVYDWAEFFNGAITNAVLAKKYDVVLNYHLIKGAFESVPSVEHFIPLIYILGLCDNKDTPRIFADGFDMSSLSMTSFIFANHN